MSTADIVSRLAAEQQFSDAMIDAMPGVLYLYDSAGRFLRWNRNFEVATGYGADEIAEMHPLDFFRGEHRRRVEERISEVFAKGEAWVEADLVARDGTSTPYHFTGRRVEFDGRLCLTGVGIDLSARRHAERRLAESEKQYRELVEHANSIILRWSTDGRVLLLNEYGQRFFGYGADEIRGRHVVGTIVPPSETGGRDLERLMEEICADPAAFEQNENDNVLRSGERVRVAWTNRVVRDATGRAIEILSVGTDVTARRRAEEAQRRFEARFRLLFDRAPVGILVAHADGRYTEANDVACRLLGHERSTLIGASSADVVAPEEHERIAPALARLARGEAIQEEWRLRRRDGTVVPVEVTATALPDGKILAMLQDLTERHRLEAQVRQAQKMEAVGRLAGGVAHDFNNLLTVINGYAEMLSARTPGDDRLAHGLGEILKAGEHAQSLTRRLLAFSRQQVVEPRVVEVDAVLADTEKLLRRLIGAAVRMETRPGAAGRHVLADPGQLEQVLLNLAVNARDAMPGGGAVTISTGRLAARSGDDATAALRPGEYVRIEVADTGSGMDEATMARIFEPFFTTKGPGKGTGLGLATVDAIVKQARGYLRVRSAVGTGTTFEILLPVTTAAPAAKPASAPGALPRGAETILLVEDEDSVRALAAAVLRDCGYRVLAAPDGDEAERIARSERANIDLLVADIVLPRRSGHEVAQAIGALRPRCRVLFMSGYVDDAELRRSLAGGTTAFLQKPLTPATLARAVRAALDAPAAVSPAAP